MKAQPYATKRETALRVLFVNDSNYVEGGSQVYLATTIAELRKRGHHIMVVAGHKPPRALAPERKSGAPIQGRYVSEIVTPMSKVKGWEYCTDEKPVTQGFGQ